MGANDRAQQSIDAAAEKLRSEAYQSHPAWRFDKRLADLLNGEYHFTPLDAEARVVSLYNLQTAWDAVQRMGWQTHTGDWDWEMRVTLADGRTLTSINLGLKLPKCETPTVNYAEVTEVGVWDEVWVEEKQGYQDEELHNIKPEQIVSITIEELG